jgi:hypothetical protein
MSDEGKAARQVAVESVVANLAGLLTVVGVSLLLARRDWITRRAMEVRAVLRQDSRRHRVDREVAEFRRQISDYEHRQGGV